MLNRHYPQRRHSLRLQGYDYTQEGAYFVTVVSLGMHCVFGEIAADAMRLNAWGEIVADCWLAIPQHFPQVALDAWVVMPNHMHGILFLVGDDEMMAGAQQGDRHSGNDEMMVRAQHGDGHSGNDEMIVRARHAVPVPPQGTHMEAFGKPIAGSLPTIIRSFKAAATKRINELHQTPGERLWHRSFHDEMITSEAMLNRLRGYIETNPARWVGKQER